MTETKRTKAQQATQAIERIYITMRHLFNRGFYKPMGVSGTTLREGLLELKPEIYGSIGEEKVEINGLIYVLDRLPQGIEECVVINLTGDEGYQLSNITPIIPPKRRRNCYRIDDHQMNVEITRGRSDIYDVLTHLTFLFIESHKIARRVVLEEEKGVTREWELLEKTVMQKKITKDQLEVALVHTANILGRTFKEILDVYEVLKTPEHPHRFLKTVYWLGKLAIDEVLDREKRMILFSPILRERLGHHIHGEKWANNIKAILEENGLLDRPIHIISANMHSVMNFLYAKQALGNAKETLNKKDTFELLSQPENDKARDKIAQLAKKQGMIYYKDASGTNIDVQLFDLSKVDLSTSFLGRKSTEDVILVMDYAFGEQAYETMDELLKPFKQAKGGPKKLNVRSVSIMGKAGILSGVKGDLMIPNAHIFEGTADNYPFENSLCAEDFQGEGLNVFSGPMITVLGTSLQNKEMLTYFKKSTWGVIGLEMEGAHYQKAIQVASKIRHSIDKNVRLAYAYYASDNPLETGSTLASGGLGLTGVKPTYLITEKILEQIIE